MQSKVNYLQDSEKKIKIKLKKIGLGLLFILFLKFLFIITHITELQKFYLTLKNTIKELQEFSLLFGINTFSCLKNILIRCYRAKSLLLL